jgi:hypothetical protein
LGREQKNGYERECPYKVDRQSLLHAFSETEMVAPSNKRLR